MSKWMQQLETISGKAASASAATVDGLELKANIAIILVLALVLIPTVSGVTSIL